MKMWECPDVFTLQDQFGKSYQIFWSADGYYVIGHLSKNHFITAGTIKSAYQCNTSESVRYYAAQTFSNTGKRVLQMAWIQSEHHEGLCYTGEMSLPVEISLYTGEEQQRLCFHPAHELEKIRRECASFDLKKMQSGMEFVRNSDAAVELIIHFDSDRGLFELTLGGTLLRIDLEKRVIKFGSKEFEYLEQETEFQVFIDNDIVELFSGTGFIYCVEKTNGCRIGLSKTTIKNGTMVLYRLAAIHCED